MHDSSIFALIAAMICCPQTLDAGCMLLRPHHKLMGGEFFFSLRFFGQQKTQIMSSRTGSSIPYIWSTLRLARKACDCQKKKHAKHVKWSAIETNGLNPRFL
jgi:hypothetical protein